jgi:Domain of unknown function (DUF4249)
LSRLLLNYHPIVTELCNLNYYTKMRTTHLTFIVFFLLLTACEKEISFNLPQNTEGDIVVEGYIEAGKNQTPPYVILTRSLPAFSDFMDLDNFFIHKAKVWINNGTDSVLLEETCSETLSESLQKKANSYIHSNLKSLSKDLNFCVYVDFSRKMKGEVGKTYHLNVKTKEGNQVSAQTTIPRAIAIDSAIFTKAPGENQNDSMLQMLVYVNDPKGADFYRYFTSINQSPYLAGRISAFDDGFIDGRITKISLLRSEHNLTKATAPSFGLWKKGDSASIKLCTIDKAHFDFWNTYESNKINNGSGLYSSVKIKHNIVGGLGIWGGYSPYYFEIVIPK